MRLRLLAFCPLLGCLCFALCGLPSLRAQTAPAAAADPKLQGTLREGQGLAAHGQFSYAADSFRKANKLAGGHCGECLRGLYGAQMSGGDFKGAASTAEAMEALATTAPERSTAEFRRASALFNAAGDKPKPDKLQAVHTVLQQALTNAPRNAAALYLDGKVLASLGQVDEAKAAFTQCAQCVSDADPAKLRAQHFAENPELSLHKMAPPFVVTALDGSRFNLDAMGGRVVLIDFWATWCGPCNAELPHMKQIAKDFAGQPLVILSVSWDTDEAQWKDFIAKHEMTWMQYRDPDHKLSNQFGVESIPHYFTIDSDGVLTSEIVGSGSDVEGKLKKLLARARTTRPQTASAAAGPGAVLTGTR